MPLKNGINCPFPKWFTSSNFTFWIDWEPPESLNQLPTETATAHALLQLSQHWVDPPRAVKLLFL